MKTKKVILIIGILAVITGIVLCFKRCGDPQAEQEKSVMTETGAAEAVPVITEASLAAAEDRTESAGSSQNSMADKTDKTNEADKMKKAEPENLDHISTVNAVETQEDGSKDNGTEELKVAGNVEKSGEKIFSSNVESLSDNDIQPTEPSAEEAGTIPAVPDETIGEGEQNSLPSAFELAQNDSKLDYEYYLNVMTPEEKQELFSSFPFIFLLYLFRAYHSKLIPASASVIFPFLAALYSSLSLFTQLRNS